MVYYGSFFDGFRKKFNCCFRLGPLSIPYILASFPIIDVRMNIENLLDKICKT